VPIVFHDGLTFVGLVWTFTPLQNEHKGTRVWHARPFSSKFYRDQHMVLDDKAYISHKEIHFTDEIK